MKRRDGHNTYVRWEDGVEMGITEIHSELESDSLTQDMEQWRFISCYLRGTGNFSFNFKHFLLYIYLEAMPAKNTVTYKRLAWRINVGFGSDESIYWSFTRRNYK
jgi:hypothetical protein